MESDITSGDHEVDSITGNPQFPSARPQFTDCKLCVFCYKNVKVCDFGSDYVDLDLSKFIKVLERYSGVDKTESLITFLRASERWLKCCVDCENIISSFCDIYHQLKCLELQLEWKLDTLVNIMKLANKVPSRLKQLKSIIKENGACEEKALKSLKAFRHDIITKCARKLSKSQPRVILGREKEITPSVILPLTYNSNQIVSKVGSLESCQPMTNNSVVPGECLLGWVVSFAAIVLLTSFTRPEEESSTELQFIVDEDEVFVPPAENDKTSDFHNEATFPRIINSNGDKDAVDQDYFSEIAAMAVATKAENANANQTISGEGYLESISTFEDEENGILLKNVDVENITEPLKTDAMQQANELSCGQNRILEDPNHIHSETEEFQENQSLENLTENTLAEKEQGVPNNQNNINMLIQAENSECDNIGKNGKEGNGFPKMENDFTEHEGMDEDDDMPLPSDSTNGSPELGLQADDQESSYLSHIEGMEVQIKSETTGNSRNQNRQSEKKVDSELQKENGIEKDRSTCTTNQLITHCLQDNRRKTTLPIPLQRYSLRGNRKRTYDETGNNSDVVSGESENGDSSSEDISYDHEDSLNPSNNDCGDDSSSATSSDHEDTSSSSSSDSENEATSKEKINLDSGKEDISQEDEIIDGNPYKRRVKSTMCNKKLDSLKKFAKNKKTYDRRDAADLSKLLKDEKQRFICPTLHCSEAFETAKHLEIHQNLHGSFKCNFCEVVQEYAPDLALHELEHVVKSEKFQRKKIRKSESIIYKCARCSINFKQYKSFYVRHHVETHLNLQFVKNTVLTCQICSLDCSGRQALKIHFNRFHKTEGTDPSIIHRCDRCPAYFINATQLTRHKTKMHCQCRSSKVTDKTHKCTLCHPTTLTRYKCHFNGCDKCFATAYRLRNHQMLHDDAAPVSKSKLFTAKNSQFICSIANCKKKLQTQKNLENHRKLHGSFTCNYCQVTMKYAPELALHEMVHVDRGDTTEKRKFAAFNCARCKFSCSVKFPYIRHHLEKHLNLVITTRTCPICNHEGSDDKFLRDHFRDLHKTDGLDPSDIHKCDQCPAYFIKSIQLTKHKMKMHLKNKCPECDKHFSSGARLRIHMDRVHSIRSSDKAFLCDVGECTKVYGTLALLKNHKKMCHDFESELIKCSKCDKKFRGEERLRNHMNAVHVSRSFVCAECGMAFKTKQSLGRHMKYHKGPEGWAFQCSECGRKFADKQKLEQHSRTHTKEKPFICQFCGEKYAHRHNWRNHVKSKHQEEENGEKHTND